jgi:CubicO group peptidase (beta-lactamase class C family)
MLFMKEYVALVTSALLLLSHSVLNAEAAPSVSPTVDEDAQGTKLITALLSGAGKEGLEKLLNEGLNINSRIKPGLSVYQACMLRGDTELARFLAERGAVTNAPMPARDALVDALFSRVITNNGPGAAVLVARNEKVLFEKGYGLANVSAGIANTPQTKFRIGSITKQFTASAILKLQEKGRLSVEDRLAKFFPDFPRGQEVTLQHLLTHTSGIRSYTDMPGFIEKVTAPISPSELIDSFKNQPYDFAPGKKWHYDNSGYFLLGVIIEKVSGDSYGQFLLKNFFKPLGMRDTGVHRASTALEREALGYQFEGGKFTNALNWDMSWAGGAGALYSTVDDLYRWNEGIFTTQVLSAASLKAAWTPVRTEDDKNEPSETGYGFGWAMAQFRGVQEISHGGGLNGFSSMLLRLPRQNFTVVVLANALPGASPEPGELAHLVTEIYLGDTLPSRPVIAVHPITATALDPLVGRYDYHGGILTVSRAGNRLYAQLTGQQRFEIFPKSETEFFWKAADAQVTFVKDEHGKVTKAIHHQNGATFSAPRLEDLTETTIGPADAQAIVGKYDYGQGKTILTVTCEGARVFAQLTGQPKFEIFPKSPSEYFWKAVDAQVSFVKDSSGKVTKAVHYQAGQVLEAPKID